MDKPMSNLGFRGMSVLFRIRDFLLPRNLRAVQKQFLVIVLCSHGHDEAVALALEGLEFTEGRFVP